MLELLIALNLLVILAAVAIPNTLEAEARSRVSRARYLMRSVALAIKAYQADYDNAPCDNMDMITPPWRQNGIYYYSYENPYSPADLKFLPSAGHTTSRWMEIFYTKAVFVPLTTPVAYLGQVPIDAFSRVVPLGYDACEISGYPRTGKHAYCMLFSSGPDLTDGNWYRYALGQNTALVYDPSNGTISTGDMIRAVAIHDETLMKRDYPFW